MLVFLIYKGLDSRFFQTGVLFFSDGLKLSVCYVFNSDHQSISYHKGSLVDDNLKSFIASPGYI